VRHPNKNVNGFGGQPAISGFACLQYFDPDIHSAQRLDFLASNHQAIGKVKGSWTLESVALVWLLE
jgi:hypothetical protein